MEVVLNNKQEDGYKAVRSDFLGYLWMRRLSPLWYLLVEYHVHQGKLNLRHPISISSGSRTYVLTVAGVTKEGPK